jgi:hypothetical protein
MAILFKKIIPFSFLLIAATVKLSAQQDETFKGTIGKTLAESKEYWAPPVTAPKGAPNIVWILLDDVRYGACSTFGGLIPTPTFAPTK